MMKIIGIILGKYGVTDPLKIEEDIEYPKKLSGTFFKEVKQVLAEALSRDMEYEVIQIDNEQSLFDMPRADVYVIIPFGGISDRWLHIIYSFNKPMIFYIMPLEKVFSYGNVYYPYFIRDSLEIDKFLNLSHKVFISKDLEDLKLTLKALKAVYKIKSSRILCIGEPMFEPFHSSDLGYAMVRMLQEKFGVKWSYMSSDKFIQRAKKYDREVDLKEIKSQASKIVNLNDERLMTALRIYYLMRELLREYDANVITINCLASNIIKELQATPCYALSRLNDEGIPAVCEADATTLLDMMITVYASESPGFMANPYIFPDDNHILLSHCTSPTLHSFGKEEKDPFILYSHFERKKGVGVKVLKKENTTVTITGISHDKLDEMLIIVGKIVKNTRLPTCRTQIVVKVQDAKKILENYKGRHWIVVYGDHSEIISKTNEILGIKSIIIK